MVVCCQKQTYFVLKKNAQVKTFMLDSFSMCKWGHFFPISKTLRWRVYFGGKQLCQFLFASCFSRDQLLKEGIWSSRWVRKVGMHTKKYWLQFSRDCIQVNFKGWGCKEFYARMYLNLIFMLKQPVALMHTFMTFGQRWVAVVTTSSVNWDKYVLSRRWYV